MNEAELGDVRLEAAEGFINEGEVEAEKHGENMAGEDYRDEDEDGRGSDVNKENIGAKEVQGAAVNVEEEPQEQPWYANLRRGRREKLASFKQSVM